MSQIAEVIVAREALLEQRYHHATNLEQEFKTLKDERASLQEAYHALHRRHVLLENAINALNVRIFGLSFPYLIRMDCYRRCLLKRRSIRL